MVLDYNQHFFESCSISNTNLPFVGNWRKFYSREECMMKAEKIDRRVKYTTSALKESLIRLLHTHPISKISVKQLCQEADVNRSTFYAHFSDPYEVLRGIEQGVIADFNTYINQSAPHNQPESAVSLLKQLLDYASERADLFQVLLSDSGDTEFQKDLMSIVQEQMLANLQNSRQISQRVSEYVQGFVIAGALKILQKWLQDGKIESSQEMAEFIMRLLFQGVAGYF